ncbi:hypothetical protein EMCRGX_G027892 [Ephydatia muelleri]
MIRPAAISFPSSASGFVYAVDRLRDLSGETESVYPMDTPIANAVKQPEWFKFAGAHGATGAVHGQALVTTTAWDPAPVGKLALCPLVALAKVETPANCLACIGLAPCVGNHLLGRHQMVEQCLLHVLLQHIAAEVMQLVHSCSLPKELSYLKAAAIRCEELADDVLVLHQLKSGLGCNLNAIYVSSNFGHPYASVH